MTPFLTCPRSTRAPDKIISPSRRTRGKPPASAQFGETLALLGVQPPSLPWFAGYRGSRVPGPRSPPPAGAVPAPAAGNSLASLAPRPGIPAARGPHARLCAAHPGLRDARPTAPSPTAETGCDRPRVAPRPVGSVPRAPGARGSGTSWSKAREGTRADPLPPPQAGGGGAAAPSSELSSRPSLPRAPSGNYPLPPRA